MGRMCSASEQEQYIAQIDGLIKNGYTLENAIKEVGISLSSYYSWRRLLKARAVQTQEENRENNSYKERYEQLTAEMSRLITYSNRLERMLGKLLIEREMLEAPPPRGVNHE